MAFPIGSNTFERLRNAFGSGSLMGSQITGLADVIDYSSSGSMFMDLLRYPGIVADGAEYVVPLTYTNGGSSVTVGVTLKATGRVTTTRQSNALLITGTQPLVYATHMYHPITVDLGDGSTWTGAVLGVVNSGSNQTVYLDTPAPKTVAARGASAIVVGTQFTKSDVGKTISFGWLSLASGPIPYTGKITAVTGSNVVTVAPVIGLPATGFPQIVKIGTDNYAALALATTDCLLSSVNTLLCNGTLLVTALPANIGRIFLRGNGRLLSTSGQTDSTPVGTIDRPIIPYNAQVPTPFGNQVPAASLTRLHGKTTVKVAIIGASTGTDDPGFGGMQTGWVRLLQHKLQAQNPGVIFSMLNYSNGGGTLPSYLDYITRPVGSDWNLDPATKWVGNQTTSGYVYAAAPDLVVIEWSANDVPGTPNITAMQALCCMLELWPSPPAIMFVLDPNYSTTAPGINNQWYDGASRLLEAFCAVRGYGVINFRRALSMLRDGFDPNLTLAERVPPNTTGAIGNGNAAGYFVVGWEIGMTYTDTNAQSAFWAATGKIVTCCSGDANDHPEYSQANNLQFGLDDGESYPGGTSDTIWVRGDLGRSMPGAALAGGTKPRAYGLYSMSAGSNSLSYAPYLGGVAGPYTSADNAKIVTVAGAGSTSVATATAANVRATPVSAGGTAIGHLVGWAKYINSTTIEIYSDVGLTVPLNAVNAISNAAPSWGALFGSPRVYTGISGIAAAVGGTVDTVLWCKDNEVGIILNGGPLASFRTTVIRPTLPFQIQFAFNGAVDIGTAGKLRYRISPTGTGVYDFFIVRPDRRMLVAPSYTDDQLNGTAFGNAEVTMFGGSGSNHPSAGMTRVWEWAMAPVNLAIP